MSALIISAFPGTGKTHCFNNPPEGIKIFDSDSSQFSWIMDNGSITSVRNKEFPANYIKHIKENLNKVDVIFVSSHKDVRNALIKEDLPFVLIYPAAYLMSEYILRYLKRGSPERFVETVRINWETWMEDLDTYRFRDKVVHIVLRRNSYIELSLRESAYRGSFFVEVNKVHPVFGGLISSEEDIWGETR
jgi:hypothetical protein